MWSIPLIEWAQNTHTQHAINREWLLNMNAIFIVRCTLMNIWIDLKEKYIPEPNWKQYEERKRLIRISAK